MSNKSFFLTSSDNSRAVSFFVNLSNDYCEIRFLVSERIESVRLESGAQLSEIDYTDVMVMHVKADERIKFTMAAYQFIDSGIIQVNGLTVFSGV